MLTNSSSYVSLHALIPAVTFFEYSSHISCLLLGIYSIPKNIYGNLQYKQGNPRITRFRCPDIFLEHPSLTQGLTTTYSFSFLTHFLFRQCVCVLCRAKRVKRNILLLQEEEDKEKQQETASVMKWFCFYPDILRGHKIETFTKNGGYIRVLEGKILVLESYRSAASQKEKYYLHCRWKIVSGTKRFEQ